MTFTSTALPNLCRLPHAAQTPLPKVCESVHTVSQGQEKLSFATNPLTQLSRTSHQAVESRPEPLQRLQVTELFLPQTE